MPWLLCWQYENAFMLPVEQFHNETVLTFLSYAGNMNFCNRWLCNCLPSKSCSKRNNGPQMGVICPQDSKSRLPWSFNLSQERDPYLNSLPEIFLPEIICMRPLTKDDVLASSSSSFSFAGNFLAPPSSCLQSLPFVQPPEGPLYLLDGKLPIHELLNKAK